MIEFSNVFLKYTKEFFALYNINLTINKGEVVCLYGKQDSGKSCIIRMITGLETPTKGDVYIKNIPLKKVDYQNDINMGYIPYKSSFLEKKTVRQNLHFILNTRKVNKAEQEALINKAVIDFKIEGLIDRKVCELSLYEKYLISVVRLSFRELEVVLIDNIFEELTNEENEKLLELFDQQFKKQNLCLIYATSDEIISKRLTSKVIKLEHGSIV